MARILIIAEHANGTLNPSTAKCVACANTVPDAEIDVAVFAADGEHVAAEIAALASVSRVVRVDNEANAYPLAAVLAPQVAALADGYTHILGPSTTFGKDLMPRVAALLGVNQVSDVMEVLGSHSFKRPVYAGNAIVTVDAPGNLPVVATVRTASYQAVPTGGGASVETASPSTEIPSRKLAGTWARMFGISLIRRFRSGSSLTATV